MRKTVIVIALLFTACNTGTEEAPDTFATQAPTETSAAQAPECSGKAPDAPPKEDGPGKTKPDVEVPDGDPPCELVSHDIYEGTGAEAKEGATVTIQYVGVSWSTGEEFDSSWDDEEPARFPLGDLIPGWQEGIPGMKEGGRRRLIIPPDLAYGANPDPRSGIEPNETLVFIIDLIKAA